MSKVIINADDFGYSRGVNFGIIDAHQKGVLSSTTIMANMPGFEHAVCLAKDNPDLGIGVHLTLTCGCPLLNTVPSIITETGEFHHLSFYENKFEIDTQELYMEWEAQIEKVFAQGIQPTHLDSHHHVNSITGITEVFVKLARRYQLPVRNNFSVPEDLKTTNRFYATFDRLACEKPIWQHMNRNNLLQECETYELVEVMCHPGYIDDELLNRSSFSNNRPYIIKELMNEKYPELFKEYHIQLNTYADI
ncbi:carbohydrate deacetylase [Enterococcus sp. CWB-B31]|uniref:carbohydrate deacetylase n=1 Tax=Enterococcus sp. CWB-B31 TaxID=2885159 RepID=UPI001E44D034|nr:carbohydrate deacetylase [Enterococcus sp. CWB-B31]MCB5954206.1 carbohydrate deacetylase [Enterococcus sp. CWB-B31]